MTKEEMLQALAYIRDANINNQDVMAMIGRLKDAIETGLLVIGSDVP